MSTEKDNPKSERDPLLERFQKACSSITPAIREEDPLFAEFAERFLWLFYYNGYRQVTWMIEACLDPDLLRSLFRYHWDNNLDDLPSGEVLMRAVQLTFHDVLDLPRETVTDHLEESFRDALEELRVSHHGKAGSEPIEAGPSEAKTSPNLYIKSGDQEKEFSLQKIGDKELCIVVSYSKAGKHDLKELAKILTHKAGIQYKGYYSALDWHEKNYTSWKNHVHRLRKKAERKGWWNDIPPEYHRSYL